MRFRAVVSCLLLCVLAGAAAAMDVRVLLERLDVNSVEFELVEGHRGYVDGRLAFDTPLGLSWPIRVEEGRLVVDGHRIGRSITLAPHSGVVEWEGQAFRGGLRFVAQGDGLLVVNVVDLEDYLRGVVPAEMQASWPLEALKAQAVAARSYTLAVIQEAVAAEEAGDYDLCATIDCQVYLGMEAEHPRTDQAVTETAGLVLTFDGEFAKTYYHSDSGGVVASSAEVWGLAVPYLEARSDVGLSSPHRRWERRLDQQAIASSLRAMGKDVGTVRAFRVVSYSESGRALRAEVVGSGGTATLEGSILTALLRGWGLKSTRFTMVGDLTARGDGWGHGVGMSQYGARALAAAGHRFEEILAFYYPQTQLQRLAASGGGTNGP